MSTPDVSDGDCPNITSEELANNLPLSLGGIAFAVLGVCYTIDLAAHLNNRPFIPPQNPLHSPTAIIPSDELPLSCEEFHANLQRFIEICGYSGDNNGDLNHE